MLGGDKTFHDRLCWLLMVPLSGLALGAVRLLFLAVELVLEGDRPGSAEAVVAPMMSLAGGFSAVRFGASIAPTRKFHAAIGLACLYGAFAAFSAFSRSAAGASTLWCAAFAALGLAGAAAASYSARGLKDDEEEPAAAGAASASPAGGRAR